MHYNIMLLFHTKLQFDRCQIMKTEILMIQIFADLLFKHKNTLDKKKCI